MDLMFLLLNLVFGMVMLAMKAACAGFGLAVGVQLAMKAVK